MKDLIVLDSPPTDHEAWRKAIDTTVDINIAVFHSVNDTYEGKEE